MEKIARFLALSVRRPAAREPKTRKPPKVLPRVLSGVLSENRGAVTSALESALKGALPVVLHRKNAWRALSGALLTAPRFLRALSWERFLEVSLFWAL